MVEWGDEEKSVWFGNVRLHEETVRGWQRDLRQVREYLFELASKRTNTGDMKGSVQVLKCYSGLAHLGDVLGESIGDGFGEVRNEEVQK